MATILLSDPDESSRVLLGALLEALGHRVVDDIGDDGVAAAVIEPASRHAMTQVRHLRSRRRQMPVICVSGRRRSITAMRLDPVAFISKPVPVGPFVRAVSVAVDRARGAGVAA
jgi:DNA-binding NtrC family response regulator